MKGILLAGGSGTRLYPATRGISKQLLPVYDKPMIYYPLSVLMMAGIKDIALISTPQDLPLFRKVLGDGHQWGIKLTYIEQPRPEGIAQAFILCETFLKGESVCLVLGDNIFYGVGLGEKVRKASLITDGGEVFAYHVDDPQRYGVVDFDENFNAISLEEKPKSPRSSFAVTGLYFYDAGVVNIAKELRPSSRGELEITDINKRYLEKKNLKVTLLGRGHAWLDTGTHASLLEASNFIAAVERRQGLKIACLEEIALSQKWISVQEVQSAIATMGQGIYASYLKKLVREKID